ncbi:MAG: GatB/YqeY domain-containing protein [Patescibacteria group bacterium]
MTLESRIEKQLKEGMKSGNSLRVSVLRMLRSAIHNAQIEKQEELEEEDVLEVLSREAKRRRESIEAYEQAGREDLRDKEKAELEIIKEFLPEPLTDEELRNLIQNVISDLGEATNLGAVMGKVMSQVKGQAEGSHVRELVEEEL